MGWVDFVLSIGLRVPETEGLAEKIKECLPDGKDPELILTPLRPDLENTEWGPLGESRDDPIRDTEAAESILEGEGYALIWYNGLLLDCSNGFDLDSNRCYSGGQLEFLRGKYNGELTVTDEHKAQLQRIAEKLDVPFKLSYSLRARGSSYISTRFT